MAPDYNLMQEKYKMIMAENSNLILKNQIIEKELF